jgi:ATP-dependent helicase YprA (DUF1998 family)
MADDGEREGGNKVARGRATSWADGTGVDAVIICEYPSTSRYITQLPARRRANRPAAQQLAVVLIALRCAAALQT